MKTKRLTEYNSKLLQRKGKELFWKKRIALTKKEDAEADSAACPHTTMPEYACILQSDLKLLLHCKLWFYILYVLIWCLNLMLLVNKDVFGPVPLHIFQIWSLVLEFSSFTKRCWYPLVQSPFLIVANCIPDQFCLL